MIIQQIYKIPGWNNVVTVSWFALYDFVRKKNS